MRKPVEEPRYQNSIQETLWEIQATTREEAGSARRGEEEEEFFKRETCLQRHNVNWNVHPEGWGQEGWENEPAAKPFFWKGMSHGIYE